MTTAQNTSTEFDARSDEQWVIFWDAIQQVSKRGFAVPHIGGWSEVFFTPIDTTLPRAWHTAMQRLIYVLVHDANIGWEMMGGKAALRFSCDSNFNYYELFAREGEEECRKILSYSIFTPEGEVCHTYL